jgi:hypothetical protein
MVRPRFSLSVPYIYYLSSMHCSKVTYSFLIVDRGGMSISTAQRRLVPEVTSSVDRATTVFYLYFVDIQSILCHFDVISAFLTVDNGAKLISIATGCDRPEVTSPSDYLAMISYRSAWNLSLSFTVQNLFKFFDFHAKCPLKVLEKGYSPEKNFYR